MEYIKSFEELRFIKKINGFKPTWYATKVQQTELEEQIGMLSTI